MWDELFAAMTRDRDRAAVLLYVSSGPRASELLGVTRGDVDGAKQLIYVVTKGTDDREAVPASPLDPARPTAHCREPWRATPTSPSPRSARPCGIRIWPQLGRGRARRVGPVGGSRMLKAATPHPARRVLRTPRTPLPTHQLPRGPPPGKDPGRADRPDHRPRHW
ncbi:integrase family protein [Streptomyces bottropensis ATCC 25435]|uniref:Integrase family protein n=1 Tax=Streptomyces bottropensis ATCC 25435 TaxID=1054862 RepID=M3FVH4_9ACTN|nr:integrase family protein [Streptomyces bottropensis ATCC 25435]